MMAMIPLLPLITCITSIFLLRRFTYSFFDLSRGWGIVLFMKQWKSQSSAVMEDADTTHWTKATSLNDLPEQLLDAILERLPPDGLCRMGAVSTFLREKCINDHFWDKHMKSKWGRIITPAAYNQEWERHLVIKNYPNPIKITKGLMHNITHKLSLRSRNTLGCPLPVDSILYRYLALENGTFWFPAQIYNRQNGHVSFMLSCYDAQLCYDQQTDTFQARYPSYGMMDIPIEKNVTWNRLRASPVNTRPYELFHSDSLKTLHPGDHLEIQWRRNKELPYGWWYGVVGHLDSCDTNQVNCQCSVSDILVLEFNQYSHDSRWRKTLINRRDHMEKGHEDIGFYGGIRKLKSREEISTWLRLWPAQVLEGV